MILKIPLELIYYGETKFVRQPLMGFENWIRTGMKLNPYFII
jgi:hypothetical protein